MPSITVGGDHFRPYLDRFNEISAMLAHLDTGANRREAVKIVNGAIERLDDLKTSDQSAIGETIALLKEQAKLPGKEKIYVPVIERFRTLADDLEQYDIPVDAWPAMPILASQYTSPQEKEGARRRHVTIRFATSGGRPRDYRRDIATLIAVELYEKIHKASPRANSHFVDFCQEVYFNLGLTADEEVAGLEDRVRRTLRNLDDPGVPA